MVLKILYLPLIFLHTLGETAIEVLTKAVEDFVEFAVLTFKLVWGKTIKIREKVLNILKYFFVFVASPFVKLSISFANMKRDMKAQNQDKGKISAALAAIPYVARFMFGKRGLAVTAFNYAAPILSIFFLFNVVTYATSATFTLKLTVNGEFLGYIKSEQIFLDAEVDVLSKVNYFGSDNVLEIIPEFAIANSGATETLTMNQVANMILDNSEFTLTFAYGFFIDGVCYGAILEKDIHLIENTVQFLLRQASQSLPVDGGVIYSDVDVSFRDNVQWNVYERFLEESIVDPNEIISMITAANTDGNPRLPVIVSRTEEYNANSPFETIFLPNDTLFEGTTSVATAGVEGVSRVTARTSYVNGGEVGRSITDSHFISAPTTQIIHNGTRPRGNRVFSREVPQPGMFVWPVIDRSGNPAGWISPGQHFRSGHAAIDIAGSGFHGTPVVAAAEGIVTEVHWLNDGYGHYIVIQHGEAYNNMLTLYSHNAQQIVTVGQQVSQGEQIATVGQTGRADGPHLHFEVMTSERRRLNPVNHVRVPSR